MKQDRNHILVISPHPDDESIGCGGTICKHVQEGADVEVVFLTSGEKGGHGRQEEETVKIREEEASMACKILDVSNVEFWRQRDGAFAANHECIHRMIQKIRSSKPATIYVTHDGEMHPDHQAAAALVKSALASVHAAAIQPMVWMYEVWTPIQQIDHIVDISAYVDVKRKAIQAHRSQCSVLRFDEAILCLNRYRGEMHSWPGGDYAEAFKRLAL